MRRLAAGLALAWLLAAGAAIGPQPAAGSGEARQHDLRQALVSVPAAAGGSAAVRTGSSPSPEQDAQALAFLGAPALPRPTAAPAAAVPDGAGTRQPLERPHPQRGPPPPLA